jgi:hypothetical protein
MDRSISLLIVCATGDSVIDKLLYQLYRLTAKEIKIVEGGA